MFIFKLIQALACAICPHHKQEELIPEPKPEFALFTLAPPEVQRLLKSNNIVLLYGLLDSVYHYTSFEDWGQIFRWIYLNEELPRFTYERWDCDKFAIWLKDKVCMHFGLNLFAFIIGDVPQGRHGFNLFYSENGLFLWEPQWVNEGEPFRIGDRGYLPMYALV